VVFDWDDHHENNSALPHMHKLKEINPAFKATLFTIPGLCSQAFIDSHPDWLELVPHGWLHPDPYECVNWSQPKMEAYVLEPRVLALGTRGFKAPGWQINPSIYRVLLDHGWWVADQHLEDHRRPAKLPTYFYEDGGWHGHVQDWGSNGIQETWDELVEAVKHATDFRFCSEATC
jgi:hypothetical protein